MTPNPPLRFTLVFLLSVIVGGVILYFTVGGERVEPRRGIHIPTVAPSEPLTDSPIPGAPVVRKSEGAEYNRYETVEFPVEGGRTESFEYLSAHLSLERAFPQELRAEKVLCLIYATPATLEEARALGESPPKPLVSIQAHLARLKGVFRESKEAGGEASGWELHLAGRVTVVSTERGARATLTADELTCYPEERRVVAAKRFSLDSEGYSVEGEGLSGHAGLGTFVVERNPVARILSGAVLGELAEGDSTTVITCEGPLLVQRIDRSTKEEEEWIPSRVEFRNGVRVVQEGPSGTSKLQADTLVLELDVRPRAPDETGGADDSRVRVRELAADGSVELESADGARAEAAAIRMVPGDDEDLIELTGPVHFEQSGVLAPGEPESIVDFRAQGGGVVHRARDGRLSAAFRGGVRARRLTGERREVLTLESDALRFTGAPGSREMVAEGGAKFRARGVLGEARQITWRQIGGAKTEIRLNGDPRVTAEAGANMDPFAGAAGAEVEPGGKALLLLSAAGSLALDEEGEVRDFRLSEGAMVRRLMGDREVFRVTADRIAARIRGERAETVRAEGSVVASGRPRTSSGGSEETVDVRATGDSFAYTEGRAVLEGDPAEARIRERGEDWNRITGRSLIFTAPPEGASGAGTLVATADVSATVFLAGKEGAKTRGFSLTCGRLEVVPMPEGTETDHVEETGASGRIDSILAEKQVVLDGVEWIAKGDRLTYSSEGGKVIELTGQPARMERTRTLDGKEYDDLFTSDRIFVKLRDEKLVSFRSPSGGRLRLHRLAGKEDRGVMGAGGAAAGTSGVERFTGACSGELTFDKVARQARMEKDAIVEQSVLVRGGFRSIGTFNADVVTGWLEEDSGGEDRLVRAEGRGNVEGSGENWTLTCHAFEVDFKNEQTIVSGSPAKIVINDAENLVQRAVYRYAKDEWEFFRATTR